MGQEAMDSCKIRKSNSVFGIYFNLKICEIFEKRFTEIF